MPFAHIPPTYGNLGLTFKTGKWHLEGQVRFNGAKAIEDYSVSDIESEGFIDRTGTSDNLESTPFETDAEGNFIAYIGTPSYTILNFYSTFQITNQLSVNLGVENIFDTFYVPFSSSIPAQGRNVVISLNGKF